MLAELTAVWEEVRFASLAAPGCEIPLGCVYSCTPVVCARIGQGVRASERPLHLKRNP